jgi:hypothetical protein
VGFLNRSGTILNNNCFNRPISNIPKSTKGLTSVKYGETIRSTESRVDSGRLKDIFKTEEHSMETIDDIKTFIDRTDKNNSIYFNFIDYNTLSDRELINLYQRKKNTLNKNLLYFSKNSTNNERNISTANDTAYSQLKKILLTESVELPNVSNEPRFNLSFEEITDV